MLILSRKRNEALIIGGDIRVTVLKTHGDTIRLGIEAPSHVSVHRDEVHARIQAEVAAGVSKLTDGDATQQDAA